MNLSIRLVEEYDASFIVDLRNNSKLNRYLNSTSANIEDQIQWIRKYKINEQLKKEFYFVIQENGIKRGLYRIYKINNVSFTVGSWLFDSCENNELPILTDLVIGDFGFYELNKSIMLFDVRKKNIKVIKLYDVNFHLRKDGFLLTMELLIELLIQRK